MCAQSSKASTTIKKYANRRLYNTATSSYVTLEDLAVMVKNGEGFNVYDAKTSEDITRSVLTQIIVEEEGKSGQQNLLPTSFLRQLIGFYGDNLQWMVPKYLEHSMDALTGNQDRIRDYFSNTLGGVFPFGSTLEEMGKQNMALFENAMRMFFPFNVADFVPMGSTAPATPSAPVPACPVAGGKTTPSGGEKKDATPTASTASVTNLKPRVETPPAPPAVAATTPMPNVANATSSAAADDMQQKIANLQKQLADLAKSRG